LFLPPFGFTKKEINLGISSVHSVETSNYLDRCVNLVIGDARMTYCN